MSEPHLVVTYYVTSPHKGSEPLPAGLNRGSLPPSVQTSLDTFIQGQLEPIRILHTFIEREENRKTSKWPELHKALEVCKTQGATLWILELGSLASHESFTQALLMHPISFYCLDQPFVNQTILEALGKHAEVQRKLHGNLIREGLKMTHAKSGNPNAAEVINKVNKPKIDTAIIFALLLEPIIQDYRKKGYSQRQMVKMLNEEGFTAPEGGKWVLSQFQKVLERVRLNEVALKLGPWLEERLKLGWSEETLLQHLNEEAIPPLKDTVWDEPQVKKLIERLEQLKDITLIHALTLNLLPILHEYQRRDFSAHQILKEFDKAEIPLCEALAI